jgi:hypothetical protein
MEELKQADGNIEAGDQAEFDRLEGEFNSIDAERIQLE